MKSNLKYFALPSFIILILNLEASELEKIKRRNYKYEMKL